MKILLPLTLMIMGLLVVAPPVAVWRALSRQASGVWSWLGPALALLGPSAAAYAFLVVMWLPGYEGQCGGWLGETSPCGFARYAGETTYWAALTLAMPGLLGILLGVAALVFRLIKRGRKPAP